jgi:hypothetical protein
MKTALLILVMNSMLSAQTQSRGDIGRQERARQKSTTSKTVVTNETLGTAAEEPPPPPAEKTAGKDAENETGKPAAEPAKQGDSKTAPATDTKPHDEAWWRDAFKQARDDVKRAEDQSKVLQLELDQLNTDLLIKSDIFNKEGQIVPLINAKNEELAKSEKALEQARQKVTQLEDELRRSGAPAGWSR